ncbi:hypothetical protein GBF38_005621, partial [Nibea albiflora]
QEKSSRQRAQSDLLMWTHQWKATRLKIAFFVIADEWAEANKPLFSAKMDRPIVLCMGEEEQAEAALQYERLWKEEVDEPEKETILEPFKFTTLRTRGNSVKK